MSVVDDDGCGYISGPEGVIKVIEKDGTYTLEGQHNSFQLLTSCYKEIYKKENQFPEDVTKLFDLYNLVFRLKLNQASDKTISSKLDEGTNLVNKILSGFEKPSKKESFLESLKDIKDIMISHH